jgi:hypothetical protein
MSSPNTRRRFATGSADVQVEIIDPSTNRHQNFWINGDTRTEDLLRDLAEWRQVSLGDVRLAVAGRNVVAGGLMRDYNFNERNVTVGDRYTGG